MKRVLYLTLTLIMTLSMSSIAFGFLDGLCSICGDSFPISPGGEWDSPTYEEYYGVDAIDSLGTNTSSLYDVGGPTPLLVATYNGEDICKDCLEEIIRQNTPVTLSGNPTSAETPITYTGTGVESYAITVPAKLSPGDTGNITIAGTWSQSRRVVVEAPTSVTLTNDISGGDAKDLTVTFNGISKAGSNVESVSITENISISDMPEALFGTWTGTLEFSIFMETLAEGHGQTYDLSNSAEPLSFRSLENIDNFEEVKVDNEVVSTDNYSVTSGSTIITFTNEYVKSLSEGAHTIDIVSTTGISTADFGITKIVELISFKVNYTTYQAEKGMTWEQWIDSEYNFDSFIIEESALTRTGQAVVDNYGWQVLTGGAMSNLVEPIDNIIEGFHYLGAED